MAKISEIMLLQQIEQPILFIEGKTDLQGLSNLIGGGFEKIGTYLDKLGELTTDLPFVMYPAYESMDEQNINARVIFPVVKMMESDGEIKSSILPPSRIVMCMHKGTYDELAVLYLEMAEWIKKKGYESTGTCYEYYYTGPDVPEQEQVTRVVLPIK